MRSKFCFIGFILLLILNQSLDFCYYFLYFPEKELQQQFFIYSGILILNIAIGVFLFIMKKEAKLNKHSFLAILCILFISSIHKIPVVYDYSYGYIIIDILKLSIILTLMVLYCRFILFALKKQDEYIKIFVIFISIYPLITPIYEILNEITNIYHWLIIAR